MFQIPMPNMSLCWSKRVFLSKLHCNMKIKFGKNLWTINTTFWRQLCLIMDIWWPHVWRKSLHRLLKGKIRKHSWWKAWKMDHHWEEPSKTSTKPTLTIMTIVIVSSQWQQRHQHGHDSRDIFSVIGLTIRKLF